MHTHTNRILPVVVKVYVKKSGNSGRKSRFFFNLPTGDFRLFMYKWLEMQGHTTFQLQKTNVKAACSLATHPERFLQMPATMVMRRKSICFTSSLFKVDWRLVKKNVGKVFYYVFWCRTLYCGPIDMYRCVHLHIITYNEVEKNVKKKRLPAHNGPSGCKNFVRQCVWRYKSPVYWVRFL